MMTDYYKVLGISSQADEKEIKSAYRKLAKKHHPDAVRDNPELTERMYEVQAAYEVLGDKEKRKQYDESLKAGQPNPLGSGRFWNGKEAAESGNGGNGNAAPDMSQFERFFGFQAGKGMETYRDKRQEAKPAEGPIDPEELFARYFGKRKQ